MRRWVSGSISQDVKREIVGLGQNKTKNVDDERRRYGFSLVYVKVLGKWISGSSGQDMKREKEMFENRLFF